MHNDLFTLADGRDARLPTSIGSKILLRRESTAGDTRIHGHRRKVTEPALVLVIVAAALGRGNDASGGVDRARAGLIDPPRWFREWIADGRLRQACAGAAAIRQPVQLVSGAGYGGQEEADRAGDHGLAGIRDRRGEGIYLEAVELHMLV